jgi:hypothetical protein
MTSRSRDNNDIERPLSRGGLLVRVAWRAGSAVYSLETPRATSPDEREQFVSSEQLTEAINARLALPGRLPIIIVIGLLASAASLLFLPPEVLLFTSVLMAFCTLITFRIDRSRRKIEFAYEPNEDAAARLQTLFTQFGQVKRIWDFPKPGNLFPAPMRMPGVECNAQIYSINGLSPALYFAPDQLYIYNGRSYLSLPYEQLRAAASIVRLPEMGLIPGDACIVGEQWLHQRKDGQPDRRYKQNRRIPTVEYGLLRLTLQNETNYQIGISNRQAAPALVAAIQNLAQSSSPERTPALPQEMKAPPRPVNQVTETSPSPRFVELTGARQSSPQPRGEIIGGNGAQFLQDARKYRDRVGDAYEPAPFKCYWPTFTELNEKQSRWYFYWRTEARRGNFLPTDTSYLFLHVYETLNLIEKSDTIEAAEYLKLLWRRYRSDHKAIDHYLPEWSGDLIAERIGPNQALGWWMELAGEATYSDELLNMLVHQASSQNRLVTMPLNIWRRLTDYRPDAKILEKQRDNLKLSSFYRRAISVADNYWRVRTKQSLVEQFFTGSPRSDEKKLFASAVIGREHSQTSLIGLSYPYVGNGGLNAHLAALLKHAENAFRRQSGLRSLRSTISLPEDLKYILDLLYEEDQSPQAKDTPAKATVDVSNRVQGFELDPARLERARQESIEVSATLTSEEKSSGVSPAILPPGNRRPTASRR